MADTTTVLNQQTGLLEKVPKTQTNTPVVSDTSPGANYIQGYDSNANYNPVWVEKGKYYPGISLTPKSSSITPEQLNTATNVTVPGAENTSTADSMVAGAKNIEDYIKMLTPTPTEAQTKEMDFLNEIAGLTKSYGQKGVEQAQAEQQAGIPDLSKQYAAINADITSKMAEYESLAGKLKDEPISMGQIFGKTAKLKEAKASEIGLLQARAQGLSGQIQVAQDTVNRAIDLKYSTIENELNVRKAQLDALEPILTREEKQLAMAQQLMLDDRQRAIEMEKEKESNIQNVMLEAIKSGIKDSNVLSQISSAKTVTDALKIMGANIPPEAPVSPSISDQLKAIEAGYAIDDSGNLVSPNVGNTDSGATVNYGDWQSGVDAVAKNLQWRKTDNVDMGTTPIDPNSQSILAQTGLSMPAFQYMTQGTSALTRMNANQRLQYMNEAEDYVNRTGTDISTFRAQYESLSKTVEANSLRNNQASVAEAELDATLQNLETAADESSFGKIRWANVAKMFAGQEFNDANVSKYAFHLNQLREEFAMYNAALAGQLDANGNIRQINEADYKKAEQIIKDGFSKGSLDGFTEALSASRSKMQTVLQQSIDAQNKQVWNLFGVGENYQNKAPIIIETKKEEEPPVSFWSSVGNWLFGD